uniref:Uncharacterized protein n=1 Tax=Arundo donax TaxID=35708 RepID=A0A0A9FS13_ARUDO
MPCWPFNSACIWPVSSLLSQHIFGRASFVEVNNWFRSKDQACPVSMLGNGVILQTRVCNHWQFRFFMI